ncbi:MAG: hypothetical protein QME64_05770 [bacterium]|nr:hypothetical protein [bacterium]
MHSEKWNKVEFFACLILILLLIIINVVLIQKYIQRPENIALVVIIPAGLITVILCYYFFRLLRRPLPLERYSVSTYILLKLWLMILVTFFLLATAGLILRLVSGHREQLVFIPVWLLSGTVVIAGIYHRVKRFQETDLYQQVDDRIRRSRWEVSINKRLRRMRFADIPWLIAVLILFLLIGMGFLISFIIVTISGKWEMFLFVPLIFGVVFILSSLYWLLAVFEIVYDKQLKPKFKWKNILDRQLPPPPKSISAVSPFSSRWQIAGDLFIDGVCMLVLLFFSMGFLLYLADGNIYKTTFGLLIAVLCTFLGFSIPEHILNALQKEKKRRTPRLDPQNIATRQKGLILLGDIFGYLSLFSGLLVISQVSTISGILVKWRTSTAEIPWISILWVWLVLALFSLVHQNFKQYYPADWSPPFILRFTDKISVPFQRVPLLNPLIALERLLGRIFRLFGWKAEIGPIRRYTVFEAKAIADKLIQEKVVPAQGKNDVYLYALYTSEEGVNPKDGRAIEWRFRYYFPSRKCYREIIVSAGKANAKQGKKIHEVLPVKLHDEWINSTPAVKAVQDALENIISKANKETLIFCLYLPASQFEEVLTDEEPLPEKFCWLISVYDEEMELVKNFYVDI